MINGTSLTRVKRDDAVKGISTGLAPRSESRALGCTRPCPKHLTHSYAPGGGFSHDPHLKDEEMEV